ncbi:MAG: type II toxin-antitoxin system Phd/YefM family antitoxin [Acidimicrobiales bacterium]
MEVGVRELKAKLSEYLSHAAAGRTVTVTDRGRPIARLVGLEASEVSRGIEEGWIEPARLKLLKPTDRHAASQSVIEVLDEDRG